MSGVVYTGVFELDALERVGWALQIALIAWLVLRRPRGAPLPEPTLAACVLLLAAAWIWRLAYGFTLVADDLGYWIGDDPMRFSHAWEWAQDPFLVLPGDPWIAGSYYLHGAAMALLGPEAIHASRFVSALYGVLPLVGVFLFTLAVFERRAIAAVAVLLVTPAWIHVLLETGLMTELPVTGLLLSGTACLLWGLRAPPGRRRHAWHAAGALTLAAATAFHLLAWIHLAVIQAGLVLARLLAARRAGLGSAPPSALRSLRSALGSARLGEWATWAALSASFCVLWLLGQGIATGNPFAQLAAAGSGPGLWKIYVSGPESLTLYPVALCFALRPLLPVFAFGLARTCIAPAPATGARARAVLGGATATLAVLMATAVVSGVNLTPFRTVLPLATALAAFAAAALFPAAPAVSAGKTETRWPRPALAVACLVLLLGFADAHHKIFEHRIVRFWNAPKPLAPHPDLFALGRWLRREQGDPRRPLDAPPARIVPLHPGRIPQAVLRHAAGEPSRIRVMQLESALEAPAPGQLVIGGTPVRRPRELPERARIGRYHIYQAREDEAESDPQ